VCQLAAHLTDRGLRVRDPRLEPVIEDRTLALPSRDSAGKSLVDSE